MLICFRCLLKLISFSLSRAPIGPIFVKSHSDRTPFEHESPKVPDWRHGGCLRGFTCGAPDGRPVSAQSCACRRDATRESGEKRVLHQRRPNAPRTGDHLIYRGSAAGRAMHPLALLCVGMYGETLPNQDGAPVRMVFRGNMASRVSSLW